MVDKYRDLWYYLTIKQESRWKPEASRAWSTKTDQCLTQKGERRPKLVWYSFIEPYRKLNNRNFKKSNRDQKTRRTTADRIRNRKRSKAGKSNPMRKPGKEFTKKTIRNGWKRRRIFLKDRYCFLGRKPGRDEIQETGSSEKTEVWKVKKPTGTIVKQKER